VSPRDPVALAGSAIVLLAVTTAALAMPARRASRIDPIEALRAD
jgi:ABC-type antimicrobial peptide transport system permease subunit